jgi:hypothetical protein
LALVDVDGEGHQDIVAGSIGYTAADPGMLFVRARAVVRRVARGR